MRHERSLGPLQKLALPARGVRGSTDGEFPAPTQTGKIDPQQKFGTSGFGTETNAGVGLRSYPLPCRAETRDSRPSLSSGRSADE